MQTTIFFIFPKSQLHILYTGDSTLKRFFMYISYLQYRPDSLHVYTISTTEVLRDPSCRLHIYIARCEVFFFRLGRRISPYFSFHSTTFCISRPFSSTDEVNFFMASLKSASATGRSGASTSTSGPGELAERMEELK